MIDSLATSIQCASSTTYTAGAALAEPATQEAIRRVGGLEPYRATPEEFSTLVKSEYARYGEIVKAVGVRVD